MKEMSSLYDVLDTLGEKAASEKGRSAIMVWAKQNPAKAKLLLAGAGTVGAGTLVSLFKE
jgi:hypothetical protein